MQIIEFHLPAEVTADLPAEGIRGGGDVQILLEGLDVVSGLISVGGLLSALPALARRIRAWRGQQAGADLPDPKLVIEARGVRIELPLPPNVSTQDIMDAVAKALPEMPN